MKRIIPIIIVVAIFISVFTVSAYAAVVPPPGITTGARSFTDSFSNFTGSDSLVAGNFNLKYVPYNTIQVHNGSQLTAWDGWNLRVLPASLDETKLYTITTYPLGVASRDGYSNSIYYWDLETFPKGTKLFFNLEPDFSTPIGTPEIWVRLTYFDIDMNVVSSSSFGNVAYLSHTFDISQDPNAKYLYIRFEAAGFSVINEYNPYTFEWDNVFIQAQFDPDGNTSVLYDILGSSNKTNTLIQDLIDKFEGSLDPSLPDVGTGEFDADLKDFLDDVNPNLGDADDLYGDTVLEIINSFASAFGFINAIWTPFISIWYFRLLVQLSLALGLFGAMAGIIGAFASRFTARASAAERRRSSRKSRNNRSRHRRK